VSTGCAGCSICPTGEREAGAGHEDGSSRGPIGVRSDIGGHDVGSLPGKSSVGGLSAAVRVTIAKAAAAAAVVSPIALDSHEGGGEEGEGRGPSEMTGACAMSGLGW
jgi:hypothetical protein